RVGEDVRPRLRLFDISAPPPCPTRDRFRAVAARPQSRLRSLTARPKSFRPNPCIRGSGRAGSPPAGGPPPPGKRAATISFGGDLESAPPVATPGSPPCGWGAG